jgi:hypothetical protein
VGGDWCGHCRRLETVKEKIRVPELSCTLFQESPPPVVADQLESRLMTEAGSA